LPISTGAAVVVIVVWRPCSSLRVLDLDGGEQLGLAHQPARTAGGVSWSGRSRKRSVMARVMAWRWAVVLMLAPARPLLVFEFVIVTKDQRSVVEGDRAIDAEEPQSRPYERALPATTSP